MKLYEKRMERNLFMNKKGGEVKGFQNGVFMLKNTEIEMAFIMPDLIEKKYQEFLQEVLA